MRKSSFALLALAAAAVLSTGAAQAQSAAYAIDPTHTFVTFEISHFGATTNRGRFDKKEGTVQFDRAGKTGKVEITVDTTSINSGTPRSTSTCKALTCSTPPSTRPSSSCPTSSPSTATRSAKWPAS